MDNSELSRKDLKEILSFIHPAEINQDRECPHIKWIAEDLAHCHGYGDWKCMLREISIPGEYGGPSVTDYLKCNHPNHNLCPIRISFLERM